MKSNRRPANSIAIASPATRSIRSSKPAHDRQPAQRENLDQDIKLDGLGVGFARRHSDFGAGLCQPQRKERAQYRKVAARNDRGDIGERDSRLARGADTDP